MIHPGLRELTSQSTLASLPAHQFSVTPTTLGQRVAGEFAQQPDLPIGAIPLLADEEQRVQVVDWNQTARPYPNACIHALFEQEVRAHPDRVAVSLGDASLTYAQLNGRANQLAHYLLQQGVIPGDHVGIYAYNRVEWLESLLACWKIRAVAGDQQRLRARHDLLLERGERRSRVDRDLR